MRIQHLVGLHCLIASVIEQFDAHLQLSEWLVVITILKHSIEFTESVINKQTIKDKIKLSTFKRYYGHNIHDKKFEGKVKLCYVSDDNVVLQFCWYYVGISFWWW